MDIITYALCKNFTKQTVDGILAGNTDLTQYYKKGEVDSKISDFLKDTEIQDLIKDFLTSDQISDLIEDFVDRTKLSSDFDVATDGSVSISEEAKGLKSSVVATLPSKTDADAGTMYFVPTDLAGTKLQAYVYNKGKNEYIPVGDMSIDVFKPNTDTADGTAGLVPAPLAGAGIQVLTNTGWQEGEDAIPTLYDVNYNPETSNIEVGIVTDVAAGTVDPTTMQYERIDPFDGATDIKEGTYGVVPKPVINDRNKLLKGDGTWGGIGLESVSNSASSIADTDTIIIKSGNSYKYISYADLVSNLRSKFGI